MEPAAFAILAALAIVLLLRRPPMLFAVAIARGARRWHLRPPGDGDDQQPETDRAPRPWLAWSVAAVAAVRVAVLLTLHA